MAQKDKVENAAVAESAAQHAAAEKAPAEKDGAKMDSANKSAETRNKEMDPLAGESSGPVELNHGEVTESRKREDEARKEVAKDPYGDTPLQQRDSHSPEVDPEKVDPTRGGVDVGNRSQRLDPMNPSDEDASPDQPVQGGTTAPA